MQPTSASRLVFPEPLGPLSTVMVRGAISTDTPPTAVSSSGRPSL